MPMDAAGLQATLEELAADYTKRLGMRVETAALTAAVVFGLIPHS